MYKEVIPKIWDYSIEKNGRYGLLEKKRSVAASCLEHRARVTVQNWREEQMNVTLLFCFSWSMASRGQRAFFFKFITPVFLNLKFHKSLLILIRKN